MQAERSRPLELTCQNHRERARRRLTELLADGDDLDLVEAALWVAAEEYADLDVEHHCGRVRLICAEGARRVDEITNPFARLDGLRTYLFEELGFRGNLEQYNDPRNSFLNEVLERRLGVPLTLSILFVEQARAAGFDARGIGLPGHFVTRVRYDGRTILVDPFHAGSVISQEDCKQLVARSTGRGWLFRPDYLEGTSERSMLARLLMNLKYAYLARSDYSRALSVVERLLLVSPGDSAEIRDRGFLMARLGRPQAAIADLERYLTLSPDAPDTKSVEGRLLWLRRRQSETN
jgi:regulator of sirC expression with transglutaminase-like and TPR domain